MSTELGAQQGAPSFYVGVGASAGGLEALQMLFSHLPDDLGIAYLVVQHLSPDFRSMMPELLAKSTALPIVTVEDGMRVEADTVYLLPPRKTMTLSGGLIRSVSDSDSGLHLPIDIFFKSLAEDQAGRGIAVVLSGTGSDGSKGLRAVKEAGGLVVVQQPGDAKFDGMPYSAVGTGLADIVETAEGIARSIASYVRHPIMADGGRAVHERVLNRDSVMQEIFALLTKESGIDFSNYKDTTVSRRIEQRMGILQLETLDDYRRMLNLDESERQTLCRDLLIGVTHFFRNPESFEVLAAGSIPRLVEETPPGESVRAWVAGCSTGEEAYSLAMLLREAVDASGKDLSIKVFATDVDPEAIATASRGTYPLSIASDVSQERLARFFTRGEDHYVASPRLRGDIVFAVHNILKDPPFSNVRLCQCRNLLIYFQQGAQRRAIQALHFALNYDGVLFLGAAESLGELSRHFKPVDEHHKIYRRATSTKLPIVHDMGERAAIGLPGRRLVPTVSHMLRQHRDNPESPMIHRAVVEELLEAYVPATVVISEKHEILHVYGDIGRYTTKLRSGQFKPTIESLIQEDLSIALSTALVKAANTESEVLYRNIAFRDGDEGSFVDLRVAFVHDEPSESNCFLVTFQPSDSKQGLPSGDGVQYDEHSMSAQRIADLEGELKRQQAHLQVTVEELETTNEELQTSNEELMAANEELQSTNEELQSLNEELYTVNSEYQEKILELSRANADLRNTINATETAIVFLDESLVIREFTPEAYTHLNLVRGDIGRPFSHISHDLQYDQLEQDVRQVAGGGPAVEREVGTRAGGILLLKIQPYTKEDMTTSGVVLSLTKLRLTTQRERELREAYRELRSTVGAAMLADRAVYRLLLVDDEESDRQLFRGVADGILGPERYQISETGSIEGCLDLLRAEDFDLAFIDLRLEDPDTGLGLLEAMHEEGLHCPTILLSGYLDDDIYKTALKLGVYDCLDKADLTPPLLRRCIRYAVRHARTERYLSEAGWTGDDQD